MKDCSKTDSDNDFLYKLTDKLTSKIRSQLQQEIRSNNLISNKSDINIANFDIKERMESYLQKEVSKQ